MSAASPHAPVERIRTFRRGELVFDVLDQGPHDGEVVLLLHGFPQLNTSWSKVAPLLHAEGYRTLAPNQRGYSSGARPRGRRPYRIDELTRDAATLVARTGAPVHVVGHDWGAVVAWVLAITRPDLVRTLTAVSVPHPGAYLKSLPRGQFLRSWYVGFFNIPGAAERMLADRGRAHRMLTRFGMTESMFADYWRDFGDGAALRGALAWYRALPFADPRPLRRPVRVPTSHVWSDGDAALSQAGARMCEQFVDAPYRFEVFEDTSHWIPEERPVQLADVVLDRIGAAT